MLLGRVLDSAVVLLLTALAIVVVLGVVFRKAGAALVWYDEVASVLLAWLTYYGAGAAALRRAHIGFPRLVEAAPENVRRLLVAARTIVVVAFFAVTAWAGTRVLVILGGTSLVSLPWIPARLTQSAIPVGAALFILAELLSAQQVWSREAGTE